MGTRDYRPTASVHAPTTANSSSCPRGHDRVPAKADGIHLENAHRVTFKGGVVFEFETPRKAWFGQCVSVDKWSGDVAGLGGVVCLHGG